MLKTIFIFKMIVCLCRGVSGGDVARAIDAGAETIEEVARRTGAGLGCGRCLVELRQALDMAQGKPPKPRIVLPTVAA